MASATSISGRRSQSSMRTTGSEFYEPPTAQEIMEHGRYLGLDSVYDAHLMWIAEESLCAPLPAFWEDHVDDDGNVYYHNHRTGQTSRYHPLDKKYKKKVLQAKMGDLQSKLGDIDGNASAAGSTLGQQQQFYKKVMPDSQSMLPEIPRGAGKSAEPKKKGGFFSNLKRLAGGGSGGGPKPPREDPTTVELNQTLQLLQKVEENAKRRVDNQNAPASSRADPYSRAPQAQATPTQSQFGGGGGGGGGTASSYGSQADSAFGSVKSRKLSRASFQRQQGAVPAAPSGGGGAAPDPHDGGPHEDVKDMAVYLRLDPQRDYRFMWIAQLAMSEAVPHNWKEMYDEQGYPYYVNQLNNKTSRRHPGDAFYNQLVKYEKIRELTEGSRQEIGAWMDFTDFDGSTYYYNFEICMSSSHRPHFGLQNKRLIDRLKLEATIELEHYVATKIQSAWRRHLVKQIVRARKVQVDAATTIQRAFRRYINRDLDKRRKMAQAHSARRIQACYRGHRARKRTKGMTAIRDQHSAAIVIQKIWRGRVARRALILPHVIRIQATFRGWQCRRILCPLMDDRKQFAARHAAKPRLVLYGAHS